jgi:hypothetical protein
MKFLFETTTFDIDWTRLRRSQKPTLFQQQNVTPRILRTAEPEKPLFKLQYRRSG